MLGADCQLCRTLKCPKWDKEMHSCLWFGSCPLELYVSVEKAWDFTITDAFIVRRTGSRHRNECFLYILPTHFTRAPRVLHTGIYTAPWCHTNVKAFWVSLCSEAPVGINDREGRKWVSHKLPQNIVQWPHLSLLQANLRRMRDSLCISTCHLNIKLLP